MVNFLKKKVLELSGKSCPVGPELHPPFDASYNKKTIICENQLVRTVNPENHLIRVLKNSDNHGGSQNGDLKKKKNHGGF